MTTKLSFYSLILSVLFFNACGGGESNLNTNNDTDSASNDTLETLAYTMPEELMPVLDFFEENNNFPVSIDSAFINTEEKYDTLTGKYVKLLSKNYTKGERFGDLDWTFKSFYEIDSLKTIGAYSDWAETRDLGNVKYSDCNARLKVELNPETTVLIWTLSYSTYEACPYGYGTYVMATVIHKGKIESCFNIAEHSGGGDPPVSGMDMRYCSISADGKINSNYTGISDDDNEMPNVDVTYGTLNLEITDGQFKIVEEKVEKTKSISRIKMNYN